MSYPRYAKYKDSGVAWLGEVPAQWGVSRLGFETWVRARLGWKGLKAEEYVDDGYVFLATPNIKGREIDFDNVNYIDKERYDESPEIILRVGDVLLAKDGSTLGTVNVIRKLPKESTVNSSIAVITPGDRINSLFLFYVFQSKYIESTIQQIKGGMGVPHLFQEDLNRFYLPRPSLEEQSAIAAFLDRETGRIDALVAEQEKLMALLAEKRQAVIERVLTRFPGKPTKLAYHLDLLAGYAFPSDKFSEDPDDIRLLRGINVGVGNISWYETVYWRQLEFCSLERYSLQVGDIVFGLDRPWIGAGVRVAEVTENDVPSLLLQRVSRLRACNGLRQEFLKFLLMSKSFFRYFEPIMTGVSVPHISPEQILSYRFVLPSDDNQLSACASAMQSLGELREIETTAEHAIDLLKERRAALISAAVTGRIDVRGLAGEKAA